MSRKAIETHTFRGFKAKPRSDEAQAAAVDEKVWRAENGIDLWDELTPEQAAGWELFLKEHGVPFGTELA